MEAKMESLEPCRCGARHPIVSKVQPGLWVVGCGHCPTNAKGPTEAEARKNWNVEVQR